MLLQAAEHLRACARHGRIGRVAAGQGCPTALLDKRALLIRTDLLELDHARGGSRALLEFVHTDRR